MNEKCHGLLGRLFGHKFQPRYDEKTTGAAGAAPQADHMWTQITVTPAIAFASDLSADLRRTIEALASTETVHTHDVCVRCGLVVPAPPKRSVTVAQPVESMKPAPAPTAPTQQAAPAQAASPSKVKVVPVSASAASVMAGQASVSHNPVHAVPGRGPKI